MATITLPEDVARQLADIARRENRSPDEIVVSLIRRYVPPIDDSESQEEAIQQMRRRFYAKAREYWRQTNNSERLALTDEELDEQFWLFDVDGIPRLKSEQGEIDLPDGSLAKFAQEAQEAGFHSGRSDISTRSREILNNDFANYLLARMKDSDDAE